MTRIAASTRSSVVVVRSLALAGLLSLSACNVGLFGGGDTVVVLPKDDQATVSLKPGQTLAVDLPMNAGTNFEWRSSPPAPGGALVAGGFSDRYSPFGRPGEAGHRRFTFNAVRVGAQTLAFDFTREAPNPDFDQHEVFHVAVR